MTERLPVFPLGTVLYPGLVLPLHIFEPRYRTLVRDLVALPEGARIFGVVAIRAGREVGADAVQALYEVGCLAELRQVEAYDDGRYDLVTMGTRRFRMVDLDNSRAYLQADLDLLDDDAGDAAPELARVVGAAYSAYRSTMLGPDPEPLPDDPTVLSYLVAAASVLDLGDKQALLEATDTTARLRAELALLRRETELLRLLPSLPAVDLVRSEIVPN